MPMGIVSDKDFQAELENSGMTPSGMGPNTGVPINPMASVIALQKAGRSKGDTNVPNSLRSIIAETSAIDGRPAALQLAESFGISSSSVSAYANGSHSTTSYDKRDENILDTIQQSKNQIATRARNTLRKAIRHITEDKLGAAGAKELASVAKDMASISRAMEPESTTVNETGDKKPQFVVYAPTFINENTLEVVHAKDNY
jgi:predicted transcriptional regulator